MGAINFTLDIKLVEALKKVLPLSTFVETGTFEGETLISVAPFFKKLFSVELSKVLHQKACEKLREFPHVEIECTDSTKYISRIISSISDESVLFWLDAHWCVADDTAGEESQCPLVQEISAIGSLNSLSVIAIDDARLFLAPPPKPHNISDWPIFEEINTALRSLSKQHELIVINDVILFYPIQAKGVVLEYGINYGIDWLKTLRAAAHANSDNKVLHEYQLTNTKHISDLTNSAVSKEHYIKVNLAKIDLLTSHLNTKINKIKEIKENGLASLFPSYLQKPIKLIILIYWKIKIYIISKVRNTNNYFRKLIKPIIYLQRKASSYPRISIKLVKSSIKKLEQSIIESQTQLGKFHQYKVKKLNLQNQNKKINVATSLLKIGIVTPSLNQGAYIEETINSILSQNYSNLQYIVQDCCSTDETIDILSKQKHPNLQVCVEKDSGQTNALNKGLNKLDADIMGWLNSDDILLPGSLNYISHYFKINPNVDVIYSHRCIINEQTKLIGQWILPPHNDEILSWVDYIPQETLFWRRKIWEKTGATLNEEFNFAMDWEFLLRLREKGATFVRLPTFLGCFRCHTSQKTAQFIDSIGVNEMNLIRLKVLGKIPNALEVNEKIAAYIKEHALENIKYKLKRKLFLGG